MPRISLASNTNRSLLKVVITADKADVKTLISLAKAKLRLKHVQGFYKGNGMDLEDGEDLLVDALLLAHRGEEFVGKVQKVGGRAELPFGSSISESIRPVRSCLRRSWHHNGHSDASPVKLRVLTFNILSPILAQGSESTGAEGRRDIEIGIPSCTEELLEATGTSGGEGRPSGRIGVTYAPKPDGTREHMSHNFRCPQDKLSWVHRYPYLQSEMLQHSPDILCLQEMDSVSWLDCQRYLLNEGYCEGVCSKALGGANNFVVLFWRKCMLQAVNEPELVYLGAQGSVNAIIQRLRFLPGRGSEHEFVLVTTHLKAGIKEKSEQERAKELNDLLSILQNFTSSHDDVILAGDLNAHLVDLPFHGTDLESSHPLRALVLPLAKKHEFRCAVQEATKGTPMSFSQWCSRCDVEIKSTIDHVLIRGPHIAAYDALMAPEDANVIAVGCLPNECYPSDHIPVIVDVSFKGLPPAAQIGEERIAFPFCPLARPMLKSLSDKELMLLSEDLPCDGRVALTQDGFKYVALPKQWQNMRESFVEAAAAFYHSMSDITSSDKVALERQLQLRQSATEQRQHWGFWTPPSCMGLHISLGKHADNLNVGKRVRFKIVKLLHFLTRKLGEPSKSPDGHELFCARWFTFEVKLIDEVRCEGNEPHITFAVFGVQRPKAETYDTGTITEGSLMA